jgi:hypothetical protein
MTKTLIAAAAFTAVFISTVNAEIWCEERRGCWETGGRIRLVHQRTERTVIRRDGNGTETFGGTSLVNDTPYQRNLVRPTINNGNGRRR